MKKIVLIVGLTTMLFVTSIGIGNAQTPTERFFQLAPQFTQLNTAVISILQSLNARLIADQAQMNTMRQQVATIATQLQTLQNMQLTTPAQQAQAATVLAAAASQLQLISNNYSAIQQRWQSTGTIALQMGPTIQQLAITARDVIRGQ